MTPSELAVLLRLDETDDVVAGAPWVNDDGTVEAIGVDELPDSVRNIPQVDPETARAARLRLIQGDADG